jgi:hypothetical protein
MVKAGVTSGTAMESANASVMVHARRECPSARFRVVLMTCASFARFGAHAVAARSSGRTLFDVYDATGYALVKTSAVDHGGATTAAAA